MPTTFNWIYLGIPRNAAGAIVVLDPTESTAGSENASQLLTAQSGLGPRVFGSAGSPLYNSITSATMINRSGDPAQLDTNTASGSLVDQFSTNIGAGTQTYNFDALVFYTGTVTYVDGTTASNVVLQVVQAESGETFLAPPASTATNAALTAKPIRSIQLDAVSSPNASLLVDRQLGIFDDGVIDGTSGNDSIGPGYVEPGTGGSDQVDGGDGLSSPATGYNDDVIRAGDGNDTVSAGLGNDSVDGGTGDDIINGGAGSDTLVGGIGADTIDGGTEADTINAGDGNDLVNLTGTFGADTITGGLGSDTLSGAALAGASTVVFNGGTGTFANGGSTASFNTIEAVITGAGADSIDASLNTVAGAVFTTGAGSDTITGGSAAETINAGADGDVIDGGAGADTIDAGLGDDRIALGASHGNDTITGGEGADTLSGGGLAGAQPATVTFSNGAGTFASSGGTASFNTIETIETGAGADSINAAANTGGASFVTGAGNDSFVGGLGAETVSGGDGDDTLLTGGGNDSVVAGDGNDSVEAGDGADYVDGGSGADTVDGGAGNDTLLGGADNDLLRGGAGDDSLLGGAGNDILLGGDGDDFLDGGPGANTLTGGAGSDTFIVSSGDIITDFSSGNAGSGTDGDPTNNDRLDLSRFYNQANLDIINAQRGANGLQPYRSVLGWLKADQEDDGVLNSLRTANGLPENFTLTIQNGGTAVSAAALTDETTGVVCFGADAMIETVDGPVPAGSLKVGDLVLTRDDGYQPIRWVGHRTLTASDLAANPAFRPIRIRQGALGGGLPDADLIVSPQHRVLARSKIAERMFGTREVLVAAKQLVVTEGIDIAEDLATVTYVHFLFDAHQIVISNGAETESLYTGDEALKSIPAEARAEILGLFPELAEDAVRPAARKMLSGRMARKLAQRHAQNGKKLVA